MILKIPWVSRIVVFIIKNIDSVLLFSYLIGQLDFSSVEIKNKIKAQWGRNSVFVHLILF